MKKNHKELLDGETVIGEKKHEKKTAKTSKTTTTKAKKKEKRTNDNKITPQTQESIDAKRDAINYFRRVLSYNEEVQLPSMFFKKMNELSEVKKSDGTIIVDYVMFYKAIILADKSIIRAIERKEFENPMHKIVYIMEIIRNCLAEAHLLVEREKSSERNRLAMENNRENCEQYKMPKRTQEQIDKDKEEVRKKNERLARLEKALKDHGC